MQTPQAQSLKTNMALTFLSTLTAVMIAVPVAIYVTANFVQPRHSVSAEQLDQLLATKPTVAKTASSTTCADSTDEPTANPKTTGVVLSANTVPASTASQTTTPVVSSPTSNTNNYYTTNTTNNTDDSTNYYKIKNDIDITNNNSIKTIIHDIINSKVSLDDTIINHNKVTVPVEPDQPADTDAHSDKSATATVDKKDPADDQDKPLLPVKKPAPKKPVTTKPKITVKPVKVPAADLN